MQKAVAAKRTTKLPATLPRCTVIGDGQEVRIPRSAWTLDGFREWAMSDKFPRRGRISYIGGEVIVNMSPEELINHNLVKGEVGRVVGNLNAKARRGLLFGDRALVTNAAAALSTEPDSTLVTWEALESKRVRLVRRKGAEGEYMEIMGSLDWLLEVVSKFSVRKDTRLLRDKYHIAKVPEYWLIDARGKKIDFRILLWETEGYVTAPVRGGWQRSRIFGRSFRLERRRTRVGVWQYTLHMKPR